MTFEKKENWDFVSITEGEDMNNFDPSPNDDKESKSISDYDHIRVTKEKNIPKHDPVITIGSGAVASAGNITAISAAAKAGKTALTGVILAGAISEDGNINGFNELKVLPNPEGKAVIHFDTEQSEDDQQYFVNSILKRVDIESTPDYFRSYNIRQLNLENYRSVTDDICNLCNNQYGGIHLIVIDGGADFIASVNDEIGANKIVQYFIHLSINYKCPVIVIVHLNPGSEKERGHFGSEIQRKCYGLITLKKDGDISIVEPKIMRKAGSSEIPLIHFTYDKTLGFHVSIDAPDKDKMKDEKNMEKIRKVAEAVFPPLEAFNYTDSISRIMRETKQGESSAKSKLKNMVGWGFIEKGGDNNYRIKMTK